MRVAKSIDELYSEVKDYDMVLCNDAPLATALNNRVEKAFIGEFAVTPRQIAGDLASEILKGPVLEDIDVVREISEKTGYSLKFVHGEVENIKRIRRYTKDVVKLLRGRSKKVYDVFVKLNTTDRAMENFDGENNPIYKGKKVAVIGTDLFDELDKYVNPKFGTFEEISLFKRGNYEIPEIRELSNNREIAENVASLINKDNCKDVAIVLDVGGKMASAMKSALYRHKISFINKLVVKDLDQTRDYIEFVSLSLSFDLLKMGQIREIIGNYGGYINPRYDNYLVKGFEIDQSTKTGLRTKELIDLMENIFNKTFDDVRKVIVPKMKTGQVKLLLDEVGLIDEKVTIERADDLIYAVNNINDLKHNEQIPDEEREGVLLVDCLNSVYVDRPIVFFIGIGDEWEKDISFLNDINYKLKDDEVDRNVERFQVLLQQGSKRVYVVNSIKDGRAATPCSYFDHCYNDKICEKFADVCEKLVKGPWVKTEYGDGMLEMGSESDSDNPKNIIFSSSSYNLFYNCPRAFMFSRVLGEPDRESTITGNYLHDYAEFRFSYPEKAKEHDVEYYVDMITEKCLNLYPLDKRVLEKSVLRTSISNINRFIDDMGVSPCFECGNERKERNVFYDDSMKLTSDQAERELSIPDKGYGGRFDLITEGIITDYKTGKPKKLDEIAKMMTVGKVTEYGSNFQPLFYFYLAELYDIKGTGDFRFFYTKANMNVFTKGVDVSGYIDGNIRNIRLTDSLEKYFRERFIENMFNEDRYAKYSGCKNLLADLIVDFGLGRNAEMKDNKALAAQLGIGAADGKRLVNHVAAELKKINHSLETCRCFVDATDRTVYITKESFQDFVKDLSVAKERYSEYFFTEFPALPKLKCKNCSFFDVCTATALTGGEEDVGDE